MIFAPVVPFGGLAGFRFLERTFDAQFETFNKSPSIQREVDYFLENAGEITSAEDLVADRRLLSVALGAFGLADEVDKRAFVRRVLEDGTLEPEALGNRLADPRWAQLSGALGFGDVGGLLIFEGTRQRIAEQFRERAFEAAVGAADPDAELALTFRREIRQIAAEAATADAAQDAGRGLGGAAWFKILGSSPLRAVIEGAYGLPQAFGQADVDLQRTRIAERTAQLFGSSSPAVFTDEEAVDGLLRRYLVTAQINNGISPSAPGAVALSLLSAGGLGSTGTANLIVSNL